MPSWTAVVWNLRQTAGEGGAQHFPGPRPQDDCPTVGTTGGCTEVGPQGQESNCQHIDYFTRCHLLCQNDSP